MLCGVLRSCCYSVVVLQVLPSFWCVTSILQQVPFVSHSWLPLSLDNHHSPPVNSNFISFFVMKHTSHCYWLFSFMHQPSPSEELSRILIRIRVNDLRSLKSAVISHCQRGSVLIAAVEVFLRESVTRIPDKFSRPLARCNLWHHHILWRYAVETWAWCTNMRVWELMAVNRKRLEIGSSHEDERPVML